MMVIETVNRAMNALDFYWAKYGTPDHRVIAQIRRTLEDHSSGLDDDWKALLDEAMSELGYDVEWKGEAIHALTRQGEGTQGIAVGWQPGR